MSASEELEKLYFPNKWVKRLSPDIVVNEHLEFTSKHSALSRQQIPSELNIPYGDFEKEKIDIFGTDLANDAPIFAFVHGGYWQKEYLERETYHYIAPILHKSGIKSIFIGYELCPKVSLPKIVQEIETSTKKCIEYAKQNGSKGLYLAGYSSGAHLLASLFKNFFETLPLDDRNTVKAIFLICGIYDLIEIPQTSVNLPLKLNEQSSIELSPLRQPVTKIDPWIYVIAASDDSPVFKEQAKKLDDKLLQSNIKSTFHLIKGADHFSAIEMLLSEDYQITKLILDAIKRDK